MCDVNCRLAYFLQLHFIIHVSVSFVRVRHVSHGLIVLSVPVVVVSVLIIFVFETETGKC